MAYEEEKAAVAEAVATLVEAMLGNGAVEEEEIEEAPPPKKRGRPAKAEAPAAAEKKPARGRGAAKKPAGPTIADVRDKLREVSDALGREEAKALLEEFDVKKVTDLEESDFAEFIEACGEAIDEAE
jgi:hypothetical protein